MPTLRISSYSILALALQQTLNPPYAYNLIVYLSVERDFSTSVKRSRMAYRHFKLQKVREKRSPRGASEIKINKRGQPFHYAYFHGRRVKYTLGGVESLMKTIGLQRRSSLYMLTNYRRIYKYYRPVWIFYVQASM
jgi:hypothetical protein